MCGRYKLETGPGPLRTLFGIDFTGMRLVPRYNIAPTQPVVAVRNRQGRREPAYLRWGFVPSWAKDVSVGSRMINARAETVHEKPAYRHAFRRRRCLIPADGFYEWRRRSDSRKRQPYLITLADESPFAMAGLWEHWQDDMGNELETCTILTTQANELVAELHDRMPVILEPDHYDDWLNTPEQDADRLRALCVPYPADLMMHRPVSTYVNNARHEGPRCTSPLEDPDPPTPDPGKDHDQPQLF